MHCGLLANWGDQAPSLLSRLSSQASQANPACPLFHALQGPQVPWTGGYLAAGNA